MYRKRYQMLDEIEEQIRNGLAPTNKLSSDE